MRPLVRVLLVTDDGDTLHGGFLRWQDQALPDAYGARSARAFHLGEFVRVLERTPWVGFDIELTKALRTSPSSGTSAAALKVDSGADVVGFRFDQPFSVNGRSRTLVDFDMVLFFSIEPGNPAAPRLGAEAQAIAQYMEAGGGFFATGDHDFLGAPLCGLIPRVRSMRRWWFHGTSPNGEPSAPSGYGSDRIDTTRPGADGVTHFEDQSDDVAQPIAPKMYPAGQSLVMGYAANKYLPHPLLCSPDGRVEWLPDHMHEGICEIPTNLSGRTFQIGSTTLREYPDYTPPNAPAGYVPEPLAPEVVATGQVLPGTTTPALKPERYDELAPTNAKTFGVIGAWDGHLIGKGRVVVDSSWHHFFDINISGDRYLEEKGLPPTQQQKFYGFFVPDGSGVRVPNAAYRMIMWYYRNIVYWLIPAARREELGWISLFDVAKRPQLVEELSVLTAPTSTAPTYRKEIRVEHYLYLGQLAEKYLAQARGACATYSLKKELLRPKIPWSEWIQEVEDIWETRPERRRNPVLREQWLGAIGLAPRIEALSQLAMGAAIVTASLAARHKDRNVDGTAPLHVVNELWPSVMDHALQLFNTSLQDGAKVLEKMRMVVSARGPSQA